MNEPASQRSIERPYVQPIPSLPARPSFFPLGLVLLVVCGLGGAGAAPASAAPRNDDFEDARTWSRPALVVVVAALAFGVVLVASASAASVTTDGRVLRYQSSPDQADSLYLSSDFRPSHYLVGASLPVEIGPGCDADRDPYTQTKVGTVRLVCPLTAPVRRHLLRYRFVLGGRDDRASVNLPLFLPGVVYGGPGRDLVSYADRAYGGDGDDNLDGVRTGFGGPGNDQLEGDRSEGSSNVLRGGPGNDSLKGPGWLYGGRGNDRLEDLGAFDQAVPDMVVGGPGRDTVQLSGAGRTVVRLRGGGADSVRCEPEWPAFPSVLLFIDRSDRVARACKRARIVLTGRPRPPSP